MNRRELLGTGIVSFAMSATGARVKLAMAGTPAVPKWSLKGTYFEACSCETVCPCIFQSPPSHGECSVLYAWQVNDGSFNYVNLNGLNVALAAYANGHIQMMKWLAGL